MAKKYTSAIILACGQSTRFNLNVKKQFYLIDNIPVLIRSTLAFENSDFVNEIIIVTSSDDMDKVKSLINQYGIKKVTNVVEGGDTRQESARLGLEAIDSKSQFVAIHDAARCLVTTEIIDKTLKDAYTTGAAVAAEKAVDTIKYATKDGFVDSTINRDYVWMIKTPQVFLANIYRAAAYSAYKDGFVGTDDSMLVEKLGFKVKLTDCGHENIKITTQSDIAVAESILKRRK